jgi:hypothetical protein
MVIYVFTVLPLLWFCLILAIFNDAVKSCQALEETPK